MLFASAYEAFNGDDRRIYNTELVVAGEEGEFAEQEGYGVSYIGRKRGFSFLYY